MIRYLNMEKKEENEKWIWIRQATKKGVIRMKSGGVCDVSYPTSKLRRARVQGEISVLLSRVAEMP